MRTVRELLFGEGVWGGDGKAIFANANQLASAIVAGNFYPNIDSRPAMAAYLSQILRRQRPCPPGLGDAIVRAAAPRRLSPDHTKRLREAIRRELEQPAPKEGTSAVDVVAEVRERARQSECQVVFSHGQWYRELSSILDERTSDILRVLLAGDRSTRTREPAFEYYFPSEPAALGFWESLLSAAEREAVPTEANRLQWGKGVLRRAEESGLLRSYVIEPALCVVPTVVFDPLSASEVGFAFFVQGDRMVAAARMDPHTLESWYRSLHRPLRDGGLTRKPVRPIWCAA